MGSSAGECAGALKLVIDADPGIDDSMTILMAFQSPNVQVVGLTTIFGNVSAADASRNALQLCEIAQRPEVPVAEGSSEPLKGGAPHISNCRHGSNGLGNISLPRPTIVKVEKSAADFLVEKVSQNPREISVLALGPLTNLALAIKRDPSFASNVKKIVILGGAFLTGGSVNPATEQNFHGDPEAADIVLTSGADIVVVGINITTQICFTDSDLLELSNSQGRYGKILSDMCNFYRDWYSKSYGVNGFFLHDPTSFAALIHPEYFTYKKGVVRVETQGICTGHSVMDLGLKKWNSSNPWCDHSPVSVAWTVDVPQVLSFVKEMLMKP